jgi:hypothetical protein
VVVVPVVPLDRGDHDPILTVTLEQEYGLLNPDENLASVVGTHVIGPGETVTHHRGRLPLPEGNAIPELDPAPLSNLLSGGHEHFSE